MQTDILLVVYCTAIVLASLAGGWLPRIWRLTHTRMHLMMSAVSGLMLGVAVLHLLPHSLEYISITTAAFWLLGGILLMFFLLRIFHFHQHGEVGADNDDAHDHDGECDHDHGHDHNHGHHHGGSHRVSWIGLAIGLSLHTAIDGVALGASVSAAADHGALLLVGLGTFLAIVLHKPLDALSITSVMTAGKWSPAAQMLVNLGFAMMCPLGVAVFRLSLAASDTTSVLVGGALAFSAGVFLCISLGDLLPEVQFHSHDRLKLSAALVVGVAVALGIELLHEHPENGHDHPHPHKHSQRSPQLPPGL